MDTIEFKCLQCKQPIGEFYVGVMCHEDLIKISYADIRRLESDSEMRDVEVYTGIQRELSGKRVKEISRYVNMVDATFPTSVILHIQPENVIDYDDKLGKMTLPFKDDIAKVLDGQHRIAGLEYYPHSDDSFQVNVTIFIGMELEDQALVFSTINKTQTAVNKSLVFDLFEFATHRSPHRTAHNIVRALNQKEGSPFNNKIKILGTANDKEKETITQATFSEALMKLLSKDPMTDRDLYKRGKVPPRFNSNELEKYPFRNLFVDEEDAKIAKIIWEYFAAVESCWPSAWKQVRPEMILNKSTGFLALMRLFREIYVHFNKIGQVIDKEEYLYLFEKIKLKDEDFNRTRYIPGASGQSTLYKDMRKELGLDSVVS